MKPIMFNTEMVRAILDGQKSVTRRAVKPQPEGARTILGCDEDAHTFDLLCGNGGAGGFVIDWAETIKAPYWPGDILYVRETWNGIRFGNGVKVPFRTEYWYKADDTSQNSDDKWRPSIHMPKEAARLFLRVTDVRVERLQEMTELDANRDFDLCPDAIKAVGMEPLCKSVWDSTIKKADLPRYGWDANPWVWVIAFERISKDEALKKEVPVGCG